MTSFDPGDAEEAGETREAAAKLTPLPRSPPLAFMNRPPSLGAGKVKGSQETGQTDEH
jgi:hypothetical protein